MYMIRDTVLTANLYDQRYSFDSKSIWLKIQFRQQMYLIKDILLTANLYSQRYSFDSKLYVIKGTVLTANVYD
jgi:hypothetical protein